MTWTPKQNVAGPAVARGELAVVEATIETNNGCWRQEGTQGKLDGRT